ncbi:MAG TPA: hypothetical protein VMN39_04120, partial [Longimicrobiaceae bacterium]|nr:hypothetical protein [Longimicrobiaceae bacterium]
QGVVVSTGNGTAIVTARWGVASASVEVRVRQKLARVSLLPATSRLAVGGTRVLSASPVDARGVAIQGLPGPSYSSSAPGIAEVSAAGVATGVQLGVAVVTAVVDSPADGARMGTAGITVTEVHPSATVGMGVDTFIPAQVDIVRGGSVTFINESGTLHDVDFGVPALNIPVHASGQHTRHFPEAGAFPYHCNLHAGMTGTVYVH